MQQQQQRRNQATQSCFAITNLVLQPPIDLYTEVATTLSVPPPPLPTPPHLTSTSHRMSVVKLIRHCEDRRRIKGCGCAVAKRRKRRQAEKCRTTTTTTEDDSDRWICIYEHVDRLHTSNQRVMPRSLSSTTTDVKNAMPSSAEAVAKPGVYFVPEILHLSSHTECQGWQTSAQVCFLTYHSSYYRCLKFSKLLIIYLLSQSFLS